jgi:hypothetical protein
MGDFRNFGDVGAPVSSRASILRWRLAWVSRADGRVAHGPPDSTGRAQMRPPGMRLVLALLHIERVEVGRGAGGEHEVV